MSLEGGITVATMRQGEREKWRDASEAEWQDTQPVFQLSSPFTASVWRGAFFSPFSFSYPLKT